LYAHEFWFRAPDHPVHQQVPPRGIQRRFGAFKVLPSWGGITHYQLQDSRFPLDYGYWHWPPCHSTHYSAMMFASTTPITNVPQSTFY
jgi:hypothetical protein